jgi:hypothetical protein
MLYRRWHNVTNSNKKATKDNLTKPNQKMTLNKRIGIRLTSIDVERLNTLKQLKKANNEVFNISVLLRNELTKQLENNI